MNAVIILFVMDIDEYIYSAISAGSSFWRTKSANQGGGSGGNSGDGGDKKDDDSVDFGVPKSNGSITQDQTLLAPAHYSENEQIETRFMQLEERIRQLERERLLTPTLQNTPPTEVFPLDATSDTSNANV